MGMYDYVKIEYPLPDDLNFILEWQTKDFYKLMENYTITKEGRLIYFKSHSELVPEIERPNYGTPEWDRNTLYQLMGSLKQVIDEEIDLNYHGDIDLTGTSDWKIFYHLTIRFTHGQVENIKVIK